MMNKTNNEENKLAQIISDFKSNKSRKTGMKKEELDVLNVMTLLQGRKLVYKNFEHEIFPVPKQSIVTTEQEKPSWAEHLISPKKTISSTQAITMNIFCLRRKDQEKALKY